MKEKSLMTAFFAGHVFDSVISYAAFQVEGWKEIFPMAASPYMNLNMEDRLIVAKMGVVALVVGLYAISKKREIGILSRPSEKAMQIGTIAVWAVQMWNVLNVVAEVASK